MPNDVLFQIVVNNTIAIINYGRVGFIKCLLCPIFLQNNTELNSNKQIYMFQAESNRLFLCVKSRGNLFLVA